MDTQDKRIHKTLVVTAFNRKLYEEYAHRFWKTFPHNKLECKAYSEDGGLEARTTHLHIHQDFVKRNKHRPCTNYKYDAVRFCYKPYAIAQAVEDYTHRDYTRLLWIDADTVFLKTINEDWITEHLYKESALATYMGRPNYYSETGVLLFNLEHKQCFDYIARVRRLYDSNDVYMLKEWHDSYVWDTVRQWYEAKGTEFYNVGVEHKVKGGHIQAHLYGEWFDHCKGKRKRAGKSTENHHNKGV